jgi:N-glycosylase/DNA lyase
MLRTVADKSGWTALRLSPLEFRCQVTLTNGQSFAWQPCAFHDTRPVQWRGVLQRHVITISESDDDAFYRVECADSAHQTDIDVMLRDYLRSNVSLHSLTRNWSTADKRFAQIAPYFGGCRLLRQHPAECLFSFLCSSNNNIPRITQMLSALRSNFGTPLGEVDQQAYFAFPTLTQLSSASEERLRELGFGYRAKFIVESTKTIISNGGEDWLMALRHKSREETHEALQQLCGVGPKVADCVALFSLDKLDVVLS